MISSGEGKYQVWIEKKELGRDLLYMLYGGEKPHIGGLVICEPGKKTKVTRFEGHFDDVVLRPIAEEACKKYKTRVVAVGGVHIDNASKKEVNILIKNCMDLIKCI